MSGPWEEFSQPSASSDAGPWSEFSSQAAPAVKPQGILGGFGSSLKRGIDSTVDYGKISLTDNPNEIAGIVSDNLRNQPQPSVARQKMNAEIDPYATEAKNAQGIVDNVGAYAKLYGKRAVQLAENPREFAGMVAENLPNSAPGLAGMVAGGIAGAATPVPFGAAIGGVVGGTAGGYKIEQGSSMFDQVVKEAQARGIDTNNKPAMSAMIAEKYPEFLKASQLKGVGTAGTDAVLNVATLGVAGIGERALAREARSVADLAKAGKMTGEEAAGAIAGIEAKNAARNTIGQKALRGAGVAAGEMAGESLSEAAGQKLAYGKLDPLDVVDEGLLAFGQGVGMAAGRKFISPLVGATDKDGVTQEIDRARAFAATLNQSVGGDVNAVPTLVTDLGPLQQRIDDLHGIGNAPMSDAERSKYEQEFNAAFGEVVGYTTDKDGMEIPFTMGDYLNSQVRSADITRDRPKAVNAVEQSGARLQQVADEETNGYVAPEIPVVGTLSAVANIAVKSGAHAQNQMQQAMQAALAKQGKPEKANGPIAAATNAQVATQGTQGAGGNVSGSVGVSSPSLAGNPERTGNGAEVAAPGLRPAVSAGIAGVQNGALTNEVARAPQPAQMATQAPQANDAQVGAQPSAASSIQQLQAELDKAEPFTERSSELTDKLHSAVTQDAQSSIDAGEMPVYKVTDHVSVAIHPSAQNPGMVQVTRYTKDGVIGDSQYNNIEEAVRFEGLTHKPRIAPDAAAAAIEKSIQAESEYQARKNAPKQTGPDSSQSPTKVENSEHHPAIDVKPTGQSTIAKRDDLVGAIMRVTGGRGIAANMAQTVVGDKANNATKVRGLFTNVGIADLDDTATLLRDEEGYDVRDGNHLSELIRSQADGNPVYSTARIEREAAAEAEKRHRDEIRSNAKKFGIKTVARPFSEIEKEVLRRIDERHTEAVNKLDARARARFDAMLKHAVEVADFDEVDAIITDAQNRFIGREFFTQATRQLRGYIDDLTRERQAQEQSNAIEETQGTSEEPDWLRSGTENPGGRSDPAGAPESARRQAGQQEAGLTLEGQTNEQAAEEFAQQQTGENGAPTKAQADKERDAVPFSLGMQSQPKPQGVQTGLFTADGRVSVEAKPADTADAKIDKSDDWLAELFGDPQSAEDKAINESQLAQQAQDKADRVDAAIAMLTGEIEATNAVAAELAARKYKSNRKQIELVGDGPGKNGSMSISAINESRKRRAIEASLNASSSIKQAIEFIAENPDGAFKQVADMESAVTKQFNEGFFGPSANLDRQLDMAVGSLIGSGSYSGEGSAGRKLRMAASAYATVDAKKEAGTDDGIRYSKVSDAPAGEELIAIHNLSAENVLHAAAIGGIPVPSIGITKLSSPFTAFGEITLIADKGMIDPENSVPVFDRDAYTARFPEFNYKKVTAKKADAFYERMNVARELGDDGQSFISQLWDAVKNARVQSPKKVADLFRTYLAPRMLYAKEVLGKEIKAPMIPIKASVFFGHEKSWRDFVKNNAELKRTDEDAYNAAAAKAIKIAANEFIDRASADNEIRSQIRSAYMAEVDRYAKDSVNWNYLDRAIKSAQDFGKKRVDAVALSNRVAKIVPQDDPGYLKWVSNEISDLFVAPTITLRGKEVEASLDNIVAAMTIGKTNGAEKTMTFGVGKTSAILGKRFKSIKEIQDHRNQVVSSDRESEMKKDSEKLLEEYRLKAVEHFTHIDWKGRIDTFVGFDAAMEALAKAGKGALTDGNIASAMRSVGFKNVPSDVINLARQGIVSIREASTDYFEAKPQRAVKLNEFNGAIVPNGTAQEVIDALKSNGITDIRTYKRGDEEGRKKSVALLAKKIHAQNKNTLFSNSAEGATQSAPITRTEAESRIKAILGDKLGKVLIDSGIVTFTNKGNEYQGATYKDGSIVLNLDALNADNFDGIFAHEGFHSTIRDLVGEETYAKLMKQLENMHAMGRGAQWVKDANAAIPSDTKAEHRTEELAAYSIEQYVNGAKQPNIITRWVESLLSALRTAIIRRLPSGKLKEWAVNNIQPQDLANLAIAGLKAKARGQLQAQGREAMAYSKINQTDTPAFKKWFGDSKVVDADGKPLVVYHGTNADFSEFKTTRGGEFGPAIYFTDSPREAGEYSEAVKGVSFSAPSAHIMPMFVRIENPYTKGVDEFWKEFGGVGSDADGVERAKAAGYDGVIAKRADRYYDNDAREFVDRGNMLTHYIAFDKSQAKSAIGNNGDFDPNNQDIRYNISGKDALSPADTSIYGMAADGKSAAEILKFIASASRNPFYRQLAKLLMKTGITPSITVGDGKGWKMNAGEGNKYAAGYNPTTNTVSLFRPASAERNMLHELMHAATLKALSGKGMAAAQMKALYQHVKKSGKLKGMYGMSDVYEFIAEAFSNPKFQEQLKKIAAPTTSSSLSSAWQWFVRIVRGILGMPQGMDNALSQALDIGLGVMRENMRLNESAGDVRYNAAPGKINQTDTEAFRKWFGDSKVVDAQGAPLRVFHGTASDITAFDIGRSGESTGNTGFYGAGAYFSEDADYASGFSFWARRSDDQAPNVVPVYLSLKNPAYINITPRSQAASEKSRATAEKIISTMIARGTDQAVVDKLQGFVSENKFEPFMGTLYNALGGGTGTTALLKEAGFDGVTIYGGISGKEKLAEAVAFDPTQIKSAIGNNGDFDPSNPDIRYNVADEGWSVSEQAKETVMRLAGRPMLDPSDPFAAENARLREQDQSLWSKAKKQLRRYLAPGGLLPQSVFAEKIKRDSEFQAVEFDVRHLIGGLEHAVKADFGIAFDKLSKEQMRPITEALAGNVPASLPEATKTAAVAMRQYIDGMSTEYLKIIQDKIDAKMLKAIESGKDADKAQAINEIELFEKIKGNIGRYVHRSYQAFDDPKWFEKVPAPVLNASRLYLKQGYMEAGETDAKSAQLAEVTLHEILKNGTAYDSMESFIAESKLGAKDLSVLMRRKEVPPQIRALLGEYPDARLNFTKSATKMGRLIWNTRFLDRVRDIGMGSFFFDGKDRPPAATTQIAADGSEVYAPLNGLWTFPEIAQSFKDALGKEQMSDLYRAIVRANGLVKYGKTVLAPTTAMRNWQSAMFFSLANGHFDLTQMKKSIAAFREQVSQTATGNDLKYLRHLKQLGVVYDTPYAGEMARLMEDARMEELLSSDKGDAVRWFRKANQLAQGFYTFGDDFWKIIGFENEKAGLMKAGLSLQEAEAEAAKRIRDTYPTYSMVGRGVQWLSRFPLAGTFVSFPAEIIRTSANMLRTVASDLKSDNPKLRELGMKRAAGVALVSAAFYGLAALSMAMAGVGDDEEEAIRDLAPEWQKNSTFLYLGRDEKGNLRYFDMSFLDPYGYWKRPITAMMRDQPWEDSLASGLRGMLEPFLGADITAKAVFEAVANRKESGSKVYKEKDGAIDQAVDIADHLRKAIQPGVVGNVERLVKAATDVRRSSGQPYSVEDELVALVGWRATTVEPKTALYYRSFEFTDALAEARKTLTDTLRDANEVSLDDIKDAKERAKAKQDQAFSEMQRLVAAAEAAGMSKMQIVQTLRLSNISQANIASLMRGATPAVTVTPQLAARAVQQARQLRGDEFAAAVSVRYRQAMAN